MRVAVILDAMAAFDDLATHARILPGAIANTEKACLHAGRVENVEDTGGYLGVRSIIKRQGDFAATCSRGG